MGITAKWFDTININKETIKMNKDLLNKRQMRFNLRDVYENFPEDL